MKKCAPNASNGAHLCAKVGDLCAKVGNIYYINVRQIEGREKKCAIEALVRHQTVFKGHTSSFDMKSVFVRSIV